MGKYLFDWCEYEVGGQQVQYEEIEFEENVLVLCFLWLDVIVVEQGSGDVDYQCCGVECFFWL